MDEKILVIPNAFYSTDEVEKIVGLEENTISRHIKAGKLKASRLGNKHRFLGQDILSYMESQIVKVD
jgi:excisionase family DNA binding protein